MNDTNHTSDASDASDADDADDANATISIDPPSSRAKRTGPLAQAKKDPIKKRDWKAFNQCRTLIHRLGRNLLAELLPFEPGFSVDSTGFGSSTYDRYGARLPEQSCGKTRAPGVSYRNIVLSAAIKEWERSSDVVLSDLIEESERSPANQAATIAGPDRPQTTDENP